MADFAGDRVDETEELKACSWAFFYLRVVLVGPTGVR
jgi:hypothetical protein